MKMILLITIGPVGIIDITVPLFATYWRLFCIVVVYLFRFSINVFMYFCLAPSKGPTDVAYGTIKKTSISVKWKAPPLSSINGYLQGYKVGHTLTHTILPPPPHPLE